MSDSIVLRKIYALDSNTGLFISSGQVLITNGLGGTFWIDMLSSLTFVGGPIMNGLPSSISSFSTLSYSNASTLSTTTYDLTQAICSIGAIANATGANIQTANLGSIGYVSTATMSTYVGQALSTFSQSDSTVSTLAPALSTFQYANSSTLSTLTGGLYGDLFSTVAGLSNLGYVISEQLASTVTGLGSVGYISSINTPISFQSTVAGLGSIGYVSTSYLSNVINTMGNLYVSSASLASTVGGLSTFGYPTNIDLSTAILGISAMKNSIRFDTVGNVIMTGASNVITFTNPQNIIFISTFYQSSIYYSGPRVGSTIVGRLVGTNDLEFSTAVMRLDSFSSFMNSNSKVTFDIYPTYSFTKLGTGATEIPVLPLSTLLKCGSNILYNTCVTRHLYAGNTRTLLESGLSVDSFNIFNQPIRLTVPAPYEWDYTKTYDIYHYMPSSVQFGALQNALHSTIVTPYFGSTGSIFVTVQNLV